jgi:hypothetical protein
MADRVFEVLDHTGFLTLVDPDAYEGFIGEAWTLEQLIQRIREQMSLRRALVWATAGT